MTIISVIGAPDWGGLQAVIERTSPFIVRRGYRRVVVCPTYKSTTIDRLQAAGAEVISYYPQRIRKTLNPLVHLKYLLKFPFEVLELARIFRRERASVIEVAGLLNLQPVFAALLCRIPLLWQLHSTLSPRPVRKILGKACSFLADVIMTSGAGMASRHGGIESRLNEVIPFCAPLSPNQFRADPVVREQVRSSWGYAQDDIVVGTLGNRGWQKHHQMLVRVAAKLRGVNPHLRFAIVGTPLVDNTELYEKTVCDLVRQLGLDEGGYVRIVDQDRSSSEVMNCFDIFALTSVAEGASLVTAEAMATGLPVVSTDVGSLCDIVHPNQNGFLVPLDDDAAMAQAIEKLLDRELRSQMSYASREIIQGGISDEHCAEAHIRAYELTVRPKLRPHSDMSPRIAQTNHTTPQLGAEERD